MALQHRLLPANTSSPKIPTIPRIVISYRRDDSLAIVGRIFDRLADYYGQEAVFRDIDAIPFGADFREHLRRIIDESNIMLAIIGPRWMAEDRRGKRRLDDPSDPVRLEIEHALGSNCLVIPALVLRAAMPSAKELPAELKDLAYRNAIRIDAGMDFDVQMERLIRTIDRVIEERRLGETEVTAEAVVEATPQAPAEAPRVFRAGDPVERDREAFVPRFDVLSELQSQLTLAVGSPAVLLYGRRRTGKSTILRNLTGGFLPGNVEVANLSMLDPAAFTSMDSFAELLCTLVEDVFDSGVSANRNGGSQPLGRTNGFRWFSRWRVVFASPKSLTPRSISSLGKLFDVLARGNRQLEKDKRRLLLTVDEYENLDQKIGAGAFTTDLLALIRESIQTHRQIFWMFAGSHHVSELHHAPWSSYLVSVRTIEVPLFSLDETRRLLTEPLTYSRLWQSDDPGRPRFDAQLWGSGGIERIHAEAGGWPHLVQLIADTVIDLLNRGSAQQADPELLEAACSQAIVRGDTALRELVQEESTLPGEWDYVRGFRHCTTQPAPKNDNIYRSLRRRLLVVEDNGSWRLAVPLMQRWLRERG